MNPQVQNAYSYAGNNPVKYIDPDGEFMRPSTALHAMRNVGRAVHFRQNKVMPVVHHITHSSEYRNLMTQGSNEAMRNSIFNTAVDVTGGKVGEALLVSTAATVSAESIVNTLVAGDQYGVYSQRRFNLPTDLDGEYDSVGKGRNDKNQHFFGSAYLTYTFGRTVADTIGIGFEEIEKYWPDQNYDDTDIETNRRGQDYGDQLKKEN